MLLQLTVMPHNLLVVDYGLGHPGSVHDAYAFQGTDIAKDPEGMILEGHWMWADSAYPTRPWCVVPFKATRTELLLRPQKVYNQYLSKVSNKVVSGCPLCKSVLGSCVRGACIRSAERKISVASGTSSQDPEARRLNICDALDSVLHRLAQHDRALRNDAWFQDIHVLGTGTDD